MAVEINTSEPNTGTPIPHGYGRVEDAHLTLSTDYVDVTLALYYNAETAATGKKPVFTFPVFTLSTEEITTPNPAFVAALAALVQAGKIQSPRDALTACLYVLLKTRPELAGAVDV